MNERDFYNKVRTVLHHPPFAQLKKLQDAVNPGLPDSVYVEAERVWNQKDSLVAWIEFKYVPTWPKKEATLVKVGLTPNQRRWLQEWSEAGGHAFCLIGVDTTYYLFKSPNIPEALPNKTCHVGWASIEANMPDYRIGSLDNLAQVLLDLRRMCGR